VDELVVENRRRKLVILRLFARILHPDDSPLAKHFTVLLARDFLRHLEHHFHQRVFREACRPDQ
jgi:hypothetical protein